MSGAAVSIIGASLTGNHGAEAMLSAVTVGLRERYPDIQVHVFSYYPSEDREILTTVPVTIHSARPLDLVLKTLPQAALSRFAPRLWDRLPPTASKLAVAALLESASLVCVAGVSFVDGRRKHVAYNVATLLPALLLGVPVVKLSQALGEFDDPLVRRAARRVLPRLRLIVARGRSTESALRRRVPGSVVQSAPDLAFVLAEKSSIVPENPSLRPLLADVRSRGPEPIVGVCPSAVLAGKAGGDSVHAHEMERLIRQLVSSRHRVIVFPTATRPRSAATHNNDLPLLSGMRNRLRDVDPERLYWIFDVASYSDVLSVVGSCNALIVSRFHAMIAGLSKGVPSVVIGWSHKYREVLESFDLADMSVIHGSRGPEGMSKLVEALIARRDEFSHRIEERLSEVVRESAGQLGLVPIAQAE